MALQNTDFFLKLEEDSRSSNIDFCANKHLEISLKCSGKTKRRLPDCIEKKKKKEKIGLLIWKVNCSFHQSFCKCWRQIFLLVRGAFESLPSLF